MASLVTTLRFVCAADRVLSGDSGEVFLETGLVLRAGDRALEIDARGVSGELGVRIDAEVSDRATVSADGSVVADVSDLSPGRYTLKVRANQTPSGFDLLEVHAQSKR